MVFYHAAVVTDEVEHLGLCATCAVYHTVDIRAQLIKHLTDNGSVSTGGREHQLTSINAKSLDGIGQMFCSAVD